MPFAVSNKLDASGPVEMAMPNEVTTISYNQYMNIVKSQTNFCQSIQEILMEGAQKISHSESTSTSVAAPTPTSS